MPVRIPRVPRVFQYSSSVVRVSDHVQEVIEYCSFQCYISCMQTMRQGLLTAYFKKELHLLPRSKRCCLHLLGGLCLEN